MNKPEITIATAYSPGLAAEIGQLMPALSARLPADPIAETRLRQIIELPGHDELLARMDGELVGVAVMSLLLGHEERNCKAWLNDFVVAETDNVSGKGVGFALFWEGVIGWSRRQGATQLLFTSKQSREAAHRFYFRQGAYAPDTTLFAHDLIQL